MGPRMDFIRTDSCREILGVGSHLRSCMDQCKLVREVLHNEHAPGEIQHDD
jgi:hypothetical protein